jgi:predicted Zn-dependent protease
MLGLMSFTRREVLGTLGIGSAQALLWACGGVKPPVTRPLEASGQVRGWLRDAVARLRAHYPYAHALAVTRRRTTAAIDVLGAGVARGRWDGLVLVVRDGAGAVREQVTSELSRGGVAAAVQTLVGRSKQLAKIDLGAPRSAPFDASTDPQRIHDDDLLARVDAVTRRDRELTSRIVYAASLLDIDDATVWSVAEGADQEQRHVRVRRALTRVAWNGTRPVVSEVARGWTGDVDAQNLRDDQIANTTRAALLLVTPTGFADAERLVLLDPEVTAAVIDAIVRAHLTAGAARRPEVAGRIAPGADIGGALVSLVDDPAAAGAYGARVFDDTGAAARVVKLIDAGKVGARLPAGTRPGHVGLLDAAGSHLRLAPGNLSAEAILDDGYVLQGPLGAVVDPASGRLVVTVARAVERRGGKDSGRVYADLELVGDATQLIASISAVASSTESVPVREEIDGLPRWRSIEAPAIRVKGLLRAKRGPA